MTRILNIADVVPVGEKITFKPAYKYPGSLRPYVSAVSGYTATVLPNGLVRAEDGEVLGLTVLSVLILAVSIPVLVLKCFIPKEKVDGSDR